MLNLYLFLLLTLILGFTIYILYRIDLNFIDYKIYNFKLNFFFILFYISIFIFGLLVLRYLKFGEEFNLKDFFQKAKEFLKEFSYLGVINITLIILILILILNIMKKFFHYQIKKRHIYYYHKSYYNTYKYFVKKKKREPYQYWDFDFYVNIIDKLSSTTWSYKYFHHKLFLNIIYKPFCWFFGKPIVLTYNFTPIFVFVVRFFPYFLLVTLVIYDCIFNNYKLFFCFNYLPFFFFYQMWKNISLFLNKNNSSLNNIIYNFYYENDKIYYINLLDIEYDFILTYIKNNFVCFTYKETINNPDLWLDYSNYVKECVLGIQKQVYLLSEKNKTKIINPYTGDELDLNDIKIIESWPLLKRINQKNQDYVESIPFLDFDSFIKEKLS